MEDENFNTQIVVHEALCYVSETMDYLCDNAMVGTDNKTVSRNVLKSMRTHLSTPAIFATLRVMRRLQEMVAYAAEAYEDGEVAFKPPKDKKRCSVNFTMRKIYAHLVKRVYKQFGRHMEDMEVEFNPYHNISGSLDGIIQYVAHKQFGIKIN